MTTINAHSRTTIADQLDAAYHLITNSIKETEIASRVDSFGYDAAELAAGKLLYDVAVKAVAAQDLAQTVKQRSTEATSVATASLHRQCQLLAEVARSLFPPRSPERQALGLTRSVPQSRPALIAFAAGLYSAAQADEAIAARLATRRYTAERLASEAGAVSVVQDASTAQGRAAAAAIGATQRQTDALAALHSWTTAYRAIARAALKDAPHLRTALKYLEVSVISFQFSVWSEPALKSGAGLR